MNGCNVMEKHFSVYRDDETLTDVIKKCITDKSLYESSQDAFYVMDMGYLVKMVDQWKQLLPRVHPCFAVKANPDPVLLTMMSNMNFGFDCASKNEIQSLIDLGVSPSQIIYSHPRKQPSYIRYASLAGVQVTVFDDEDELYKIKEIAPSMGLLLRLSTKHLGNTVTDAMPENYGCLKKNTSRVLALAKKLDLNVIGVSFHIGVSIRTPTIYARAIAQAKLVFTEGRSHGYEMKLLDIGGGFPAATTTNFSTLAFHEVASAISQALEDEFCGDKSVSVIAEPGTHFSMPSAVLVANIIGKRNNTEDNDDLVRTDQPEFEYFVNDGIFQSFTMHLLVPYVKPVAKPVDKKYTKSQLRECRIWGQTCAREDLIINCCDLPDMNRGDWLYFADRGAYSYVMGTNFNGFNIPSIHRFVSVSTKRRLDELVSGDAFVNITISG